MQKKVTRTVLMSLLLSCVTWIAPISVASATGVQKSENEKSVAENQGNVVRLDETVISGNQELPKVLYILPWREPQGLPEIEIQAEFTEAEVFRRLYPPAYRRELKYFETLDEIAVGLDDNQEN